MLTTNQTVHLVRKDVGNETLELPKVPGGFDLDQRFVKERARCGRRAVSQSCQGKREKVVDALIETVVDESCGRLRIVEGKIAGGH
jgi:hypothetical protein